MNIASDKRTHSHLDSVNRAKPPAKDAWITRPCQGVRAMAAPNDCPVLTRSKAPECLMGVPPSRVDHPEASNTSPLRNGSRAAQELRPYPRPDKQCRTTGWRSRWRATDIEVDLVDDLGSSRREAPQTERMP